MSSVEVQQRCCPLGSSQYGMETVKTVTAKSACKMHSVFPAGSRERWYGALDFVQEFASFLQQMP